jgi:hypothetical protein
MSIFEKIKEIYPSLIDADFDLNKGTILLQNDSNGVGDYIKSWNHPSLPQPTQEQLDGVK